MVAADIHKLGRSLVLAERLEGMLLQEVVCKMLDLLVVTGRVGRRVEQMLAEVEVLHGLEVGVGIEERNTVLAEQEVRTGLVVGANIVAVIVEQLVEEQKEVELVGLVGVRLLLERQYR